MWTSCIPDEKSGKISIKVLLFHARLKHTEGSAP